jgi:hypothetical protein
MIFLALQTCGGAVANLLSFVEIHVALTKVCGKRKYSPDGHPSPNDHPSLYAVDLRIFRV